MNIFTLIGELLPVIEGVVYAIESSIADGKAPDVLRSVVMDHMAELPGKIRAA